MNKKEIIKELAEVKKREKELIEEFVEIKKENWSSMKKERKLLVYLILHFQWQMQDFYGM